MSEARRLHVVCEGPTDLVGIEAVLKNLVNFPSIRLVGPA